MKNKIMLAFAALAFGVSGINESFADSTPVSKPGYAFQTLGSTPVLSGGRLKPLDSFARDMVLFVTGSTSYSGWNSIELLLSWTVNAQAWFKEPIIFISRVDVKKQLLVDEKTKRFSPEELLKNPQLLQYAGTLDPRAKNITPPMGGAPGSDPRQQEIRRIIDRLSIVRALSTGEAWSLIPSHDPEPWQSIASALPAEGETAEKNVNPIVAAFRDVVTAYRDGNTTSFASSSQALHDQVIAAMGSAYNARTARMIRAEVSYNRAQPFLIAWILYLIAGLLYVSSLVDATPEKFRSLGARFGHVVIGAAFAIHITGFVMRVVISGRPPVTNMYESVIWVSFGAVFFSIVLYVLQKTKHRILLSVGSFVGMVGLMAANSAPAVLDPSIHPLVPVLRSNFWLTIHVLTITLSYAAFALSMGIANVSLFQFLRSTDKRVSKIETLNLLSYRAMQFGVVLLAAGTLLGGFWADYSWGRFWGWDPKETWALIALLCYIAMLHARFVGWVNPFTFPVWTVLSFLSVLMAWYGVNFVLGVGLHSYGFSSGGMSAVVLFTAVQLTYVVLVAAVRRARHAHNGEKVAHS